MRYQIVVTVSDTAPDPATLPQRLIDAVVPAVLQVPGVAAAEVNEFSNLPD